MPRLRQFSSLSGNRAIGLLTVPFACRFGVPPPVLRGVNSPLTMGTMKRGRVVDPHIGDTPVSCRRDSRGDFVTMADAIEALIARHPGLTAAQISQKLF